MKRLFALVLALSVGTVLADGKCFFRPGDTWVLSGDSITYIGLYRQTVKDALDHFHPGNNITVCDTSVWGQKVAEATGKGVELKPTVVTIMLGMNNVVHKDFPVAADYSKGARGYGSMIRTQVRQYQALGAEVVLMAPTLSDETENSYFAPWNTANGLREYGREIQRVAYEEHCRFVPVAEEFEAAKRKLKARQTFITDGVHPYGWGQYEIARSLIHHLNVAEPFPKDGEKRGFNARELPPQDFAFRVTKRFAAAKDEAPEFAIRAAVKGPAKIAWSVEGTDLRGEDVVTFGEDELVYRPQVPAAGLPSEPGAISRLILSVKPAAKDDSRVRMAVVDLARTRVLLMKNGVCEGEVTAEKPRPEGPRVATWRVEERGPDLWFSGRSFASTWPARPKPPAETWMNSGAKNGFMMMLDLRPADRFADNNFDRDMHMVFLQVLQDPWCVLPLAWEGRLLQNALFANADRTEDGFTWTLGVHGYVADYIPFDVRKLDHFGFNIVFCDDNAGNMELFPIMGYKGLRYLTPEQRLNQTIIVDRKGDVPQAEGATTNVGVYGL